MLITAGCISSVIGRKEIEKLSRTVFAADQTVNFSFEVKLLIASTICSAFSHIIVSPVANLKIFEKHQRVKRDTLIGTSGLR